MPVRDEILAFLRNPTGFAGTASDPDTWLRALEYFAMPSITTKADWELRPAQEAAWRGLANQRVGLVLGPPGTGKTHLLSWLIAGYLQARREAILSGASVAIGPGENEAKVFSTVRATRVLWPR